MNFKLSAFTTCLLLAFTTSTSFAQDTGLIIPNNVKLPQDTLTKQLISALNGFLAKKEKPNKDNPFVLKEELLATSALLDEMKGIEQNVTLKAAGFYRPYLTNVVKQGEGRYAVQFSYIGVAGDTPLTRASFKVLAKQVDGRFYFYSPLRQNTSSWKVKSHGVVSFHYRDTLSSTDAKEFIRMVALYNKKLNTKKPVVLYYCADFLEVQQLLGIEYMADNAGMVSNQLGADENNTDLIINGWSSVKNRFDPHDLFHDRLRTVMSSDIINRPVDEGCAYLYGGSWGKSWPEVSAMFNTYVKDNPNADWLQLYQDGKNYYNDGGKIFKISYMINALIVQKLEKEKGFEAVMELLGCGKREAGDANYFKVLEKLTGINKANFNSEVSKLIKGS